jgi:hypothetical protein
MPSRKAAEFVVNKRREFVQRLLVAGAPVLQ